MTQEDKKNIRIEFIQNSNEMVVDIWPGRHEIEPKHISFYSQLIKSGATWPYQCHLEAGSKKVFLVIEEEPNE